MSISTRKERQKEELKGKILQAARDLFMERGFEQTSIRNIAEKIEYSPTTIYLYFKDKDEIFYALHQEGFAVLNKYFKALEYVSDPFERLKAMAKAYTTFAAENAEFYDLMFILQSPMDALNDESRAEWKEGDRAFGFLFNTVVECQQKGYFTAMDPEIVAFTVWSMVHGVSALRNRGRCKVISEENEKQIVPKATDLIIEVLERMHKK